VRIAELLARAASGEAAERPVSAGSEAVPATPRLVRYLVEQGVLLPPEGGRRHAEYPEENVARLATYRAVRAFGGSASAAAQILAGGGLARSVAPGFVLVACPPPHTLRGGWPPPDPAAVASAAGRVAAELLASRGPVARVSGTGDPPPTPPPDGAAD